MNPDWVELAAKNHVDQISVEIEIEKNPELYIPDLLWHEIKIRKGWFPLRHIEQV